MSVNDQIEGHTWEGIQKNEKKNNNKINDYIEQ